MTEKSVGHALDGFEIFMSDLVNTVIDIQKLSSTSGSPLRSKGIPG